LVLFGAAFAMQSLSKKKEPPKKAAAKSSEARGVSMMEVVLEKIGADIEIQGRLAAYDKLDLFTEVSGMLIETGKDFKVGNYFKKGDLLVRVDQEEARLSLLAQRSSLMNAITQLMPDLKIDYPESFVRWKNYLDQFDVKKTLIALPDPINDQEKYFIAARNLHNQFYSIKSAEARLSKYSMYAPFSGVLTRADINKGSLVRAGQSIGQLMNTANYELEATVSMADLKYLEKGNTVELYSDDVAGTWTGKIKRISDQIDPSSQSIIVYIGVNGKGLREGMYLRGKVAANSIENAFAITRDLIINQKAVYTVKDSVLKLLPIEIVRISGDKAIIRGLENGQQVLDSKVPAAFEGMKVKVQ